MKDKGQGVGFYAILTAVGFVIIMFVFVVLDQAITEHVYPAALASGANNTTATQLLTVWGGVPWVMLGFAFLGCAMYALQGR